MRLTIVGTGYVGLVTGVCLANTGNDVTCLDIDPRKIEQLNRGEPTIYEPGLKEMMLRNARAGRLHFTTDKQKAYGSGEIIFICVGTPSDDRGRADLTAVMAVARDIGDALEAMPVDAAAQAPVVVVKSTVPVGTNIKVKAAIASRTKKPFRMASNPEFLKEGAAVADFTKPDRVVVGAEDEVAADKMRELYESFVRQGNPIYVMDIVSAEMVKYASNTMLATKISFINEISALCESFGADIDEVRRGMCSDKRIGNQFLYPGLGYGGSCFPKDVLACISMGDDSNTPTKLLQSVHEVNQHQRHRFIAKIDEHFRGNLKGKKIAVWGLAFKPGTDDMREAPSVTLIEYLLSKGAVVQAYDPVATETARQVFGEKITYAEEPLSVLNGAEALLVCTDWDEFKNPSMEDVKRRLSSPVVFDGRNLYKTEVMAELGITYYSVGRKPVNAPTPAGNAKVAAGS